MHHSIHPKRLTRPRPARLLAAATLMSAILVAGCGGSSPSPDRGDGRRREHPGVEYGGRGLPDDR
jgi:hypothetical protein